MFVAMKNRFRLVKYGSCGGMYYWHDTTTGHRASLGTKDKNKAAELLVAKNESVRDPSLNLQKSRIYAMAADPNSDSRTWRNSIAALIASKPRASENRARLERFSKEKALVPILDVKLLETRATDHGDSQRRRGGCPGRLGLGQSSPSSPHPRR